MSRYRVNPRHVKVVEMKDGTEYRVSRNGYVNVRPEHEREMDRGVDRFNGFGAESVDRIAIYGHGEGKSCTCGFEAWPWQRTCPKCGSSL